MTYPCPALEFAVETEIAAPANPGFTHHWKFFKARRTSVRDLHVAFQIPYVYDYITKLRRQQAEVIQDHGNENILNIEKGEARHRKYKRLKLGGSHM
jgi:hypothetical protein